jgi:2-polyprenyl-3-methyl-5-hydroxy-6-metoxy-1,4-benzoquinol methylase
MTIQLASRNRQSELMDDPALDEASHRHALTSLGRINRLSRSDKAVWKLLKTLAGSCTPDRPLTILDIAAGGGDLAIRLSNLAQRDGVSVNIDGCDISPTALQFSTDHAAAAKRTNISFHQCDALNQPFPKPEYDVVMCSLFLHHLKQEEAVRLLQRMKAAATQLVLVDDLRRTKFGYWLAWLGCRILTRCQIVHVDGPMSVEGAFTTSEAKSIAVQAGLRNAVLKHRWPQRFLLTWRPTGGDADGN